MIPIECNPDDRACIAAGGDPIGGTDLWGIRFLDDHGSYTPPPLQPLPDPIFDGSSAIEIITPVTVTNGTPIVPIVVTPQTKQAATTVTNLINDIQSPFKFITDNPVPFAILGVLMGYALLRK